MDKETKDIIVLLVVLVWWTLVMVGTGYVVFVLGRSGWWFLLALIIACAPSWHSEEVEDGQDK